MDRDDLGDRMKAYEGVSKARLTPRVPVMIRLDGKAFHTYTRGMERPFDRRLMTAMWETAKYLCENIQGCQVAYVQSDEITLLLTDYATLKTQGWFDYEVQKMVSVAASMASAAFNDQMREAGTSRLAAFDARAWNLPKDEVVNAFIWRQQDATRNSIQMVGRAHFSHKDLHEVSCDQIQEKLFQEKGINWDKLPTCCKRGACVVKEKYKVFIQRPLHEVAEGEYPTMEVERSRWAVDTEIPIFTQDRQYIEKFVNQVQE